jgi:hypothetical protein
MSSELTKQYMDYIGIIAECKEHRELLSLTSIYDSYKRPRCKSPRRVIRHRELSGLIEYLIIESNYRVEEVIKFTKENVYVNWEVALAYLNCVDIRNYIRALSRIDEEKISKTLSGEVLNISNWEEYPDLPF